MYIAELDLDALARPAIADAAAKRSRFRAFPSIARDISIIVDDILPAAKVRGTIRSAAPDTLVSVREFDRYQGKGVPERRVSLSLRLTFRSPERTLTDAEVQKAMDAIIAALITGTSGSTTLAEVRMSRVATARNVDLEPIDRLEEKVKMLIAMIGRLRADQARAAEENLRLSRELEAARARIAESESGLAEVATLRMERESIRDRVSGMLEQLEGLSL